MHKFGDNWLFDSFHRGHKESGRGKIYFSYLLIGLLSLLSIYVLTVIPVLWLLAILGYRRLSWRSWLASILGAATPYWIIFGIGFIH